jgi:hypothetical protein
VAAGASLSKFRLLMIGIRTCPSPLAGFDDGAQEER